jgi:hypothetical protein
MEKIPVPQGLHCIFFFVNISSLQKVQEKDTYMTSCLSVRFFIHIFQLGNCGNHANKVHKSRKVNKFFIYIVTLGWVMLGLLGKVRLGDAILK